MFKKAILGSGKSAKYLHKLQNSKSIFFIDEKLKIEKKSENGVKIFHPSYAFKKYKDKIQITAGIFNNKFDFKGKKKLLKKNYGWKLKHFNNVLLLKKTNFYFWGYNKNHAKFKREIKRVAKLFKERKSVRVLKNHLLLRCNKLNSINASKMWDLPKISKYKQGKNTFVDVGAYDGDSIKSFLESGLKSNKIIAFEPDKQNFKKLKKFIKRISTKNVFLINEAIYNYNGTIPFNFNGNPSSSIANQQDPLGLNASCRTLDFLTKEKNNLIIKIDAEGCEWEIVASSYRLLRAKKPVLAVALYHKIDDIIDIPTLLEKLADVYDFFLRAHSSNGSDLYLYCVPKIKQNKKFKNCRKFSIFSKNFSFSEFNKIAGMDFHSSANASGFPDVFRNQGAVEVHNDIIAKLNLKNLKFKKIIEIGPGVSPLPQMMSSFCRSQEISLKFIDGQQVLNHLPSATFIEKIPSKFPDNIETYFHQCRNAGAVICYSVCQYLRSFYEFEKFIDCAISLLAPSARLLVGDIPNKDMRIRFLNSYLGKKTKSYIFNNKIRHMRFLKTQSIYLNDANLLKIIDTQRRKGNHAWVIPQNNHLPQSNRREDLLIQKK